MRVTPPPAALSIAAAVAALALLAHPSSAGAERWQRPVPGGGARSFDYSSTAPFARGAHRGADLAAAPGDPVRAACDGLVAHAGPVPGGARAVTLVCGTRRVTHLPLRQTAVEPGVRVRAGTRIGTLAAGHGGLHLGVRAAADPFGYQDPLALLPRAPDPPPAPPARVPAPSPAPPAPVPALRPARPALVPIARRAAHSTAGRTAPTPAPFAPPAAWAGLAVATVAAAGTGAVVRGRRRRSGLAAAAGPAAPAQSSNA
jgi:hypothetical protein